MTCMLYMYMFQILYMYYYLRYNSRSSRFCDFQVFITAVSIVVNNQHPTWFSPKTALVLFFVYLLATVLCVVQQLFGFSNAAIAVLPTLFLGGGTIVLAVVNAIMMLMSSTLHKLYHSLVCVKTNF